MVGTAFVGKKSSIDINTLVEGYLQSFLLVVRSLSVVKRYSFRYPKSGKVKQSTSVQIWLSWSPVVSLKYVDMVYVLLIIYALIRTVDTINSIRRKAGVTILCIYRRKDTCLYLSTRGSQEAYCFINGSSSCSFIAFQMSFIWKRTSLVSPHLTVFSVHSICY